MLNLLQKYRRQNLAPVSKQQYLSHFLAQEEHGWIERDADIRSCFEALFTRLPLSLAGDLLRHHLCFVPASEYKQQGPSRYQLKNTVVVFPEFQRVLSRDLQAGTAFIAHEVGLVLYELSNPADKDPLMAEVEADKFVCDLGLSDELEQLLLTQDETDAKRLRLTYLTLNAFGVIDS
jgi:hypothetical protein